MMNQNLAIRAIIVDDELNNRENLYTIIREHYPTVEIIGMCGSALEARKKIIELEPDLIFLDIEMPGGDGFSLLESLTKINFEVIFITAFSSYAIKAIKFSALDYILKPIDTIELVGAINRAATKLEVKSDNIRMKNLIDNKSRSDDRQTIALPLSDRVEFLEISKISRCESDRNYTTFYTSSGDRHIVSRTLKEYDELLSPYNFLRVHQSHLINLAEVRSYIKRDGGYILMKDGTNIPISRQRRDTVIEMLNHIR